MENRYGMITKKVVKREQSVSKSKRCGKIFEYMNLLLKMSRTYGYAYYVKRIYKLEIYRKNKERLNPNSFFDKETR